MTFALGLVALLVASASLGGLAALVARLGRPGAAQVRPVSDALLRFEPQGGRHRLPVRGFETSLMTALAVGGAGFLLYATDGGVEVREALVPLSFLVAALVLGVWWCWRRGVLRPARQGTAHPGRRTHGGS